MSHGLQGESVVAAEPDPFPRAGQGQVSSPCWAAAQGQPGKGAGIFWGFFPALMDA